ncbi:MAG TPA: cytochrome ubiquinol oxidase subunit I [Candidatus Limnocylindrales bacterium]|nr:cytochrome ubiquinol oxidase subunit I [Candidatus Limnocylindrales bacterium]
MDPLMLARWQFGITTVYHFLFVPLTIGLAFSVAGFQTAWYRTGKEQYLRLTRFFGELFLINFALGVVTGIVQEFQFGMNWSEYSRFVGDIFGAPLAIEGLLAFFLESTFIGLWIFGWGRLSKGIHLATIWVAAVASAISAYIILAANSWMQHPVGYTINEEAGRAELTDFLAVLTNSTALITFPHTIAAAFMTTGAFLSGIALYRLVKGRANPDAESPFRAAAKAGAVMLLIAGLVVAVTGDIQGKIMTEQQPMKMAAAEALWETEQPAAFSLFTIGTPDGSEEVFSIKVPFVLSFLATGDFNGKVYGINDLQAMEEQQFGPGDYTPNTPVTYWTFRLMIGMGVLAAIAGAWFLWTLRKGGLPGRGAVAIAIALPFLPLAANSFAWMFTEIGRQPWIVYGLMLTAPAVTPTNPLWEVALTMTGFTVLYGALAAVMLTLVVRRVRDGLPAPKADTGFEHEAEPALALGY